MGVYKMLFRMGCYKSISPLHIQRHWLFDSKLLVLGRKASIVHPITTHVFLHLVCKRTQKSLAYKTRLALKSSSDAYKMFVILSMPSNGSKSPLFSKLSIPFIKLSFLYWTRWSSFILWSSLFQGSILSNLEFSICSMKCKHKA